MTEVLSHVGVLDLIVKRSPRPEAASEDNADDRLEWYRKDILALRAIRLNISGSVLPFIFFPIKYTALEMWDRLKDFPTAREFQKAIVFQRWSTMMLGKSVSVVEYGRAYKQIVQQVWSRGTCLSENDVLVRFILSVPGKLGKELQSRISAFDGRTQFLTLDHLVAWSQEIQDGVYVPRPNKLFRGGCAPASVGLPKCLYCGSHVNRDSCCKSALDRFTGAKGVTAMCRCVSKSVRQTVSFAFRVPRSIATEAAIVSPLIVASMQQKRGSEVKGAPQKEEEAASTVIFRLGPPQIVETPNSLP